MQSKVPFSKYDLQKLICELEFLVDEQVKDARSKVLDTSAPSEFRIGEKAYAKGLLQMGTEIVKRLKTLI